jgi:exoribonuclease R
MSGILHTKDYKHFEILNTNITFQGAKLANKCLPGDKVTWDAINSRCNLLERNIHPILAGTVHLTSKIRYGLTSRKIPIYLFVPYRKDYPPFITGCSEADITKNRVGLCAFQDWGQNSQFPRANLLSILGISGNNYAEIEALLWTYCNFNSLKERNTVNKQLPDELIKELNIKKENAVLFDDTREVIDCDYTFNIDPDNCKDIDDVLSIKIIDKNTTQLWVTISDVAEIIEKSTEIDQSAMKIGQTYYSVKGNSIQPMLPREISESICSLHENATHIGVSISFIIQNDKIIEDSCKWSCTRFANNKSYTYDEFQSLWETKENDIANRIMHIASILSGKNITDTHDCIAAYMLFYNRNAALLLREKQLGGILRRHNEAKQELLNKCKQIGKITNTNLEMLAYESAEYCAINDTNTTHYGLGMEEYCHITSPIRRYADLINQRVLKNIIKKYNNANTNINENENENEENIKIKPLSSKWNDLIYLLNTSAKAAKKYQKDSLFISEAGLNGEIKKENAIVVNIEIYNDNNIYKAKISAYIDKWKKVVSFHYLYNPEKNTFQNMDNSIQFTLYEGQPIVLLLTVNLLNPNWKDRLIINVDTDCLIL